MDEGIEIESVVIDGEEVPLHDVKQCSRCESAWRKGTRRCGFCQMQLPTIAEARAERERLADRPPTMNAWPTRADAGAATSLRPSYAEPAVERDEVDGLTRQFQTLPLSDLNPAGPANLRHLMGKFGRMVNLRACLCDNDTVPEDEIREWCVAVSDLGAKEAGAHASQSHILTVLGSGHEDLCYLRVLSRLVYHVCSIDVCDLLHFETDASLQWLASGKNAHLAHQIILIMRRVATAAICREFLLAHPHTEQLPTEPADLQHFYEWLKSKPNDKRWTMLVQVMLLRDVPAYMTWRSGVRENNARKRSAGRSILRATLCSRNAPNYAKAVVLEDVMIQHRAPKEVRKHVEQHCTVLGTQGLDFVMEERNRRVKAMVGSNTLGAWKLAVFMQDKVIELTHAMRATTGMNLPVASTEGETMRTLPNTIEVERNMQVRIYKRFLAVPSDGDQPPASIGGTLLSANADGYYEAGVAKLAEFMTAIKECPPGGWPNLPSANLHKITDEETTRSEVNTRDLEQIPDLETEPVVEENEEEEDDE